jgi:hypothetical protein
MKDFLGQDLAVGDMVILVGYGENLQVATVERFTAQKVRVKYFRSDWGKLKNPKQVAKMSDEQATWYSLNH